MIVLQDMNTQLFPAPPFIIISSNPMYELFPGRMRLRNIDFLKMQAFFISLRGCSKMSRCEAPEILSREAYFWVR
jgi:hypothetical protein